MSEESDYIKDNYGTCRSETPKPWTEEDERAVGDLILDLYESGLTSVGRAEKILSLLNERGMLKPSYELAFERRELKPDAVKFPISKDRNLWMPEAIAEIEDRIERLKIFYEHHGSLSAISGLDQILKIISRHRGK